MNFAKEVRLIDQLGSCDFFPERFSNEIYWSSIIDPESYEYESCFSIKFVSAGKESYVVDNDKKSLVPQTFLIVNEGSKVVCLGNGNERINEAFSLFIDGDLLSEVYNSIHNYKDLLEPNEDTSIRFSFYNEVLRENDQFMSFLNRINTNIKAKTFAEVDQSFYFTVCTELLGASHFINEKIANVHSLRATTRAEVYKRINCGRRFIEENYNQKLDLEAISRFSMMSPFHFLRSFKQVYGVTPHRFQSSLKIKEAIKLIQDDEEVKKIAWSLGYPDVFTFSKQFKIFTGSTPGEFRRSKTNEVKLKH